MFENDDGTLFVQVGVVVEPSDTTPRDVLGQLPYWRCVDKDTVALGNGRLNSTDFFEGTDWRDHLSVLIDLIQGDVPVLKQLVSLDTQVTINVIWTGEPGSAPPQVTPEDLGSLCFPGMKLEINADWDSGNHVADWMAVSFCVYGPDPDQVSEFLGEAGKVRRIGDAIYARGKIVSHYKNNAWTLGTKAFCTSSDLFEHLEKLYERLGPPTLEWRDFVKATSADVQMRISYHAANGQTVPVLSYKDRRKMGGYGAELVFETEDFLPYTKGT